MNDINGNTVYEEQDDDCQPNTFEAIPPHYLKFLTLKNLSVCKLKLKMKNTGKTVIENFKIYFQFENVIQADFVSKSTSPLDSTNYSYDIKIGKDGRMEFCPIKNILVQGDCITIDDLCFKTSHKARFALVKWELFSRNTYQNGELGLKVLPQFEHQETITFVDDKDSFSKRIRYRSKFI